MSEDKATSSSLTAELEALTTKRASLEDRMKKRREALGTLLSQVSTASILNLVNQFYLQTGAVPAANVAKKQKVPPAKKPTLDSDLEPIVKRTAENDLKPTNVKSKPDSDLKPEEVNEPAVKEVAKRRRTSENEAIKGGEDLLNSLLSARSAKEKEGAESADEIMALLAQPTAREKSLLDTFKSRSGGSVKEFCQHSTKAECLKLNGGQNVCRKLHFVKILQPHTDESLGDCSFLNTCFHMDTCKYVHYEVDEDDVRRHEREANRRELAGPRSRHLLDAAAKLVPPQWVQCDLRSFDLSVLGKFAVVMADPPWDIHMELPYGTMSDDEMRRLPVPSLQDEGLIFLWVTGRAMELGRECLKLWGYRRVDELIWVKTNQLQRIIRTGRTGHWLNHGKEHCLVGAKEGRAGELKLNRGLDCDVIVAEVRATSHKPDEIYAIIERLSPGTRKIELFGRPHNAQPNWVTLGNQLDGVVIHDEEMMKRWNDAYPEGYEFVKGFPPLIPRRKP